MPSIEIVCIDQEQVCTFADLPFRLRAQDQLVSDRTPRPLFQPEFDALQGCIYHLYNPMQGCTGFKLLRMSEDDWSERNWSRTIYFLPEYAPSVRVLLAGLLQASPVGRVLFTSDYQFGPRVRRYRRAVTLEHFRELHDAKKLHMNVLYPLRRLL